MTQAPESNDKETQVSQLLDDLFEIDNVEFVELEASKFQSDINKALDTLANVQRCETKRKAYQLLLKIVENILLDPWSRDKRKLRESNATFYKHIGNDPLTRNVLTALGFVSLKGFQVLQVVDVQRLRKTYRWLIAALNEEYGVRVKSLESHFFDPFKPYIHNADVNKNENVETFEITGKDVTKQRIQETQKLLSKVDNSTSLNDWNPVITLVGHNTSNGVITQAANDDSTETTTSASLVHRYYNLGKNNQFESASKHQLDTLVRKCQQAQANPITTIKIRLASSRMTLELQVPNTTSIGHVKNEVQKLLVDTLQPQDWFLAIGHQRTPLDESKTFLECDLIARIVLQLCIKPKAHENSKGRPATSKDVKILKDEALELYLKKQ